MCILNFGIVFIEFFSVLKLVTRISIYDFVFILYVGSASENRGNYDIKDEQT